MTEREQKIVHAAKAWAKAERALRNLNDRGETGIPRDPEEHRRIGTHCDYTEQVLLDLVEGPKPPRFVFVGGRRTGRSWMFDEISKYVQPKEPK